MADTRDEPATTPLQATVGENATRETFPADATREELVEVDDDLVIMHITISVTSCHVLRFSCSDKRQ